MKQKIKDEIAKHKKFSSGVLGIKEKTGTVADIEIRNYAKYVLREGAIAEKRELLRCLKSKILMSEKKVWVAEII